MPLVGLHASHEQLPPSSLLDAVVHAEQAGFEAAMCSDHWAPWSVRQGQSGAKDDADEQAGEEIAHVSLRSRGAE